VRRNCLATTHVNFGSVRVQGCIRLARPSAGQQQPDSQRRGIDIKGRNGSSRRITPTSVLLWVADAWGIDMSTGRNLNSSKRYQLPLGALRNPRTGTLGLDRAAPIQSRPRATLAARREGGRPFHSVGLAIVVHSDSTAWCATPLSVPDSIPTGYRHYWSDIRRDWMGLSAA